LKKEKQTEVTKSPTQPESVQKDRRNSIGSYSGKASGGGSLDYIKDPEGDAKSSNLISPRRAFSEAWGAADFNIERLDSGEMQEKIEERRKEIISKLKLDTSSNPLKSLLDGLDLFK